MLTVTCKHFCYEAPAPIKRLDYRLRNHCSSYPNGPRLFVASGNNDTPINLGLSNAKQKNVCLQEHACIFVIWSACGYQVS